MFTYNQSLNNEYRNRQETKAEQLRLVNEISGKPFSLNINLNKQLAQIILTVSLFVALFIIGGGRSHAQDSSSLSTMNGGEGEGGNVEILFLAVGVDALMRGDIDEAIRGFEDSLAINPDFVAAYAARSLTYLMQSNIELALVDAEIGYSINPEAPEINFVLGAIYYELGEFEMARGFYEVYLTSVTDEDNSEPALMVTLFSGNSITLAQSQIYASSERLSAVGG